MLLAKSLACMRVEPVKNADGNDVIPELKGMSGYGHEVRDFEVLFEPRGKRYADLAEGPGRGGQ